MAGPALAPGLEHGVAQPEFQIGKFTCSSVHGSMRKVIYLSGTAATNLFLMDGGFAGRVVLKVGVLHDSGGAAGKHKADCGATAAAGGKTLAPEDGGGMVFAMEVVPDGVNARFRDLVSRFVDLFGLRCALHQCRRSRKRK